MRLFATSAVIATLVLSSAARAEVPTADEVRKVFDFVEKGQGQGLVLMDAKLCNEIPKTGDHKFECTEQLTDGIPAGTKVYVWIGYLLPKTDVVKDVTVQVKQDGTVRETKDIDKLEGYGSSSRTWTVFTAKKAGTWTAAVMRGDAVLKTLSIKVVDK